MKVQVELDELLELQARVVELEEEVERLNKVKMQYCTTITDRDGNKHNFPDTSYTMD